MYLHYWELLSYRALAELKRDSSNMYLGMLWWVLEPVLYMFVFYLVFGLGLRKGGLDYVLYLLCGLVPWKWLDSTVRTSSGVITGSVGLMRQLYFPKWILPGYIILANTYKFFIVLALLLLFLIFAGVEPSVTWFSLPVLVAAQFLLVCAFSGLAAALVPLVPDLKHVVNYGMTMLFFITGIFFDVSELGEPVKSWLMWNPTLVLIDAYRGALLNQLWPDWYLLGRVVLLNVLLFLIALLLIKRLDRYYPRVVS
ncbi:MAG TPA: ABC transporter permease [Pseudomonadales bacterium]|nr:ABC transporter permease [Pseudomonadales bacterium]